MVEGYNNDISNDDSIDAPDSKSVELLTWIRAIQKGLTVEVDHGFINIQGRTNKFSVFVSSYLLTCLSLLIPEDEKNKLKLHR